MHRSAFILGSHPALSIAEILHVATLHPELNLSVVESSDAVCIASHTAPLDYAWWQHRLGGTVKIAEVIDTLDAKAVSPEHIADMYQPHSKSGKNVIGVSQYAIDNTTKPLHQAFGISLKKQLKSRGISCRVVPAKTTSLSSAQVIHNKLITKGAEICLIRNQTHTMVGLTQSVQPIDAFVSRDYKRPEIDSKSGMLPPKLARMLINLTSAQEGDTLLDPFCGSGTLLLEGMDMPINTIIGTDISKRAIHDSKANVEWFAKEHGSDAHVTVFQHDVTEPFTELSAIECIAGEGYLGPPRQLSEKDRHHVIEELEELYDKALKTLAKLSTKETRIALAIPTFKTKTDWDSISLSFVQKSGFTLVKPLPNELMHQYKNHLTSRGNLRYARPTARVGRELLLLLKQDTQAVQLP